jgi:hypothetical protein
MLRPSKRTAAEVEAYKRSCGHPTCDMPRCLGLNDEVPGGIEGINRVTYVTPTGKTRVLWLCDTHRAGAVDANGQPLDMVIEDGGVWGEKHSPQRDGGTNG